MSDYGIKVGCYKYKWEENDNGRIVHIKSLTKQFVECDVYNYYDNEYSMPHITKRNDSQEFYSLIQHLSRKKKKISCGSKLCLNHFNRYDLAEQYYIGDNTYLEWKQKNKVEEEQPPSPDDGTAEYDIDEQLAKEKETEVVKIFATEVKEVINDSIMKDPEVCKLIAKQHILEIIVNELFKNPCPYKTQDKYYIEVCSAIHKL